MKRLLSVLLAVGSGSVLRAGGGPENVALVVNEEHESSRTIADEYAKLRGIPSLNVIRLKGIPAGSTIGVEDFREKILRPVLAEIERRGLSEQIDYLVYSDGFPYGVEVKADTGGKPFPKVITLTASLTGLTFLYDLVLAKDTAYLDLNANRYFRTPKMSRAGVGWTPEEQRQYATASMLLQRYADLVKARAAGKDAPGVDVQKAAPPVPAAEDPGKVLEEAIRLLTQLDQQRPGIAETRYNLACALALQGKLDAALEKLKEAVAAGWSDRGHTEKDTDFAALREKPEFKALLEQMTGRVFEFADTEPFRHAYQWDPLGKRSTVAPGRRYLLSTMLAWTGGKGTTTDEALAYLRRSVEADGTRPTGTVYLLANGDVRSTTREWAFSSTLRALKELGVKAERLNGVLPKDKSDVQGLVVGAAGFEWASCGSTIRPGAICEHLTSCGGILTGAGQQVLSEFLRNGAAGASGTVTEPYAIQNKFPNAYMHVHYARGASLAEAFYQSVAGPYQLLIVGDPLCRPWARIPKVRVEGLTAGDVLKAPVVVTGKVEVPEGTTIVALEFFVDGVRWAKTGAADGVELAPARLGRGEHELRVVAVTDQLETRGGAAVSFWVGKRPKPTVK
jgi:tetratricopeptide (TPR) repeat protein